MPFFLKSSSILTTSAFARLIPGKCATASIPYLFFIVDAISKVAAQFSLPPAPYVTLINAGFISDSSSRVLYIVSIGMSLLGGKTSKENTCLLSKILSNFILSTPQILYQLLYGRNTVYIFPFICQINRHLCRRHI